jgi:hypothetical protein
MPALDQAPVPAALPAGRAAATFPADLLAGHVVGARLDQRQVQHAGHVPAQVVAVRDGWLTISFGPRAPGPVFTSGIST